MTPQEEAVFEKKAERHFKGQRELPKGRNFRFWEHEKDIEADRKYRENFDKVFPSAPGNGI